MQCPACRAKQVWSPECRRCGADLTLLRRFNEAFGQQRLQVLAALGRGQTTAARRHAIRLYQLRPDAESARLLAVCQLITGNFARAWQSDFAG